MMQMGMCATGMNANFPWANHTNKWNHKDYDIRGKQSENVQRIVQLKSEKKL